MFKEDIEKIKDLYHLETDKTHVIYPQNKFAYTILTSKILKNANTSEYVVFEDGEEDLVFQEIKVTQEKDMFGDKVEREELIKKKEKKNKYLIIKNGDKNILSLKETVSKMKRLINYNVLNLDTILGYTVNSSKFIGHSMFNKKLSSTESFHPSFIGGSGSGKSIAIKSMLYQLGQNPYTEFFVIDKGGDFSAITDESELIKNVAFHADYEYITSVPQRFLNFMFYLIVYYNQKMVQINNLGFNSYKEYYREVTKQIKESGESTLPVIPFSVVVIDEIETQRMAIPKKYHDEFDNLVGSFYNVARSGGFKVIGGSQTPTISRLGSGFKGNNVSICYFKMGNQVKTGLESYQNRMLSQDAMISARVFAYNGSWVKGLFDKALVDDSYLRNLFEQTETKVKVTRAHSVGELTSNLLSGEGAVESHILKYYKKFFKLIGFSTSDIVKVEKSDYFFEYVVLLNYLFTAYSNEQLGRKDLSIANSKSTYEDGIDQKLHQQFMQTISPEKEKEIKNILLGQINGKDDESLENFYTLTGKLFRDWFVTEIQKDRSHVLSDFGIDDGERSKESIEIPLEKEEKEEVQERKETRERKEETSGDNSKSFGDF